MNNLSIANSLIASLFLILMVGCGGGGGGSDSDENDPVVPPPVEETAGIITGIDLSMGLLQPAFDPEILTYTASLSYAAENITIKPEFTGTGTLFVDGVQVTSTDNSIPLSLSEGETTVEISMENSTGSTTYTLNLDRQSMSLFTQSAYIKASNPGNNSFGFYTVLDGNTLAVGAYTESSNASGVNGNQLDTSLQSSGAVYVFVNENGEWQQQAYLKSSNPDIGDIFGASLALDGDTLVVGATREDSETNSVNGNQLDNGAEDAGAAYVFVREAGIWRQQAYLKASNSDAEDRFGETVAIFGDTIAVSATGESSNARGVNAAQDNNFNNRSGAVYVFTRNGEDWSQQAYIKASNSETADHFGIGLAIYEDTLAVGATQEASDSAGIGGDQGSNTMQGAGAVYLFERVANQWTQSHYIKASNTGKSDRFGGAVALEGNTLVVSAYLESSNSVGVNGNQSNDDAENAGAVYVFVKQSGSWRQQAYIKASNASEEDTFGWGVVALKGERLLVGARKEKSRSSGVNGNQRSNYVNEGESDIFSLYDGAAYLFERSFGSWRQIAYFKASNTHENMAFGGAVALSDDFIIVGAENEKSPGTGINPSQDVFNAFDYAGAVYVFPSN